MIAEKLKAHHALAKTMAGEGAAPLEAEATLLGGEADFNAAWQNEFSSRLLHRVFLQGYFANRPGQGAAFIEIISEAMREKVAQAETYGRLRHMLRQSRRARRAIHHDDNSRVRRRVKQLIGFLPAEVNSFLDLGNGNGKITQGLAKHFSLNRDTAIGVDMVERAKESKYYRQAYVSPEEPLPLPGDSIQVATMLMVLHHLNHPDQALAEVHRVLKPGGILLIRESDACLWPLKNFCAVMEDFYYKVFNYFPTIPLPNYHLPIEWWVGIVEQTGLKLQGLKPVEDGNPFAPVYLVFRKESS